MKETNKPINAEQEISLKESEKGFSLIELLVSMIIFLIVTGSIFAVMQIAQTSRTVVNQQVPLNKSFGSRVNLLGRDTYNAGYAYPLRSTVVLPNLRVSTLLQTPPDSNNTRDTMAPIVTGNNLRPNTFNRTAGVMTDQVTFLYKDTTFNRIGAPGRQVSQPLNINAATTSAGIDEIIPISGSNAACRVNDIFLVTGNTGSTLGVVTALSGTNKVQFSNGDILNFNKTGSTGPLRNITTPATMFRVFLITFFVTPDGTLMRREFGNDLSANLTTGFVDEPLVYGVEDFQVQYVMDDGTLTDSPTEAEINLAAIRQVRYTITARSTDTNATGQPATVSMTQTFSTRNLGYDAN